MAWGRFPVITSVSTTSLPIEGLAWPSITVCNQGGGLGAVERVYKVQLERYIKEKGISIEDLNDEQINKEENKFLVAVQQKLFLL